MDENITDMIEFLAKRNDVTPEEWASACLSLVVQEYLMRTGGKAAIHLRVADRLKKQIKTK